MSKYEQLYRGKRGEVVFDDASEDLHDIAARISAVRQLQESKAISENEAKTILLQAVKDINDLYQAVLPGAMFYLSGTKLTDAEKEHLRSEFEKRHRGPGQC